jgi:hypothetical protein
LPFDSARSPQLQLVDSPNFAGAATALAHFDARHPYLLFRKSALPGLCLRAGADRDLQARFATLRSEASTGWVPQEPRAAIKRRARHLITTAFVALTADGEPAQAALAAARSTLDGFAAAASWKQRPVIRSFLDCAEIAVAVALAYDWLYTRLAPRERRAIERAIRRNVLEPALAAYQDRSLLWPKRRDNCSLVSNSGILVAALAVVRPHRELSAELVRRSLASSWNVFEALAPDGAWREGPSYWSLAMRYAGLMVAALESALGDSFGLADRPGFAQTGDFALHASGPFGAAFNFGDSDQRFDVNPLSWHAHRFGRPVDGWLLGEAGGGHHPFTTIWPRPAGTCPETLGLPTGKVFRSGDLACFRSTWSADPRARPVYLAIKGGNVRGPVRGGAPRPEEVILHAQADAGTFVLDGARHRWVVDLGPDDYDLPGYFDHGSDTRSGPRWQYYRARAAGHNTLTIGGLDQVPNAPATIVGSNVEGDCKWVVLDLSAAYGKPAGTVRRGAALIGRQVVIQDEADPAICGDILWAIHTGAEPTALAGSLARFRLGGDRLAVRILEPAGARFELAPPPPPRSFARPAAHQLHGRSSGGDARVCELPRRADEEGKRAAGAPIKRLQIRWPAGARRLTVLLLPDCDGDELALPVAPLDHWLARRPLRLTGVPRRGWRTRGVSDSGPGSSVRLAKSGMGYSRQDSQASLDHA